MTMPEQRVIPALRISNYERSKAFYTDKLGFGIEWESPPRLGCRMSERKPLRPLRGRWKFAQFPGCAEAATQG